MPLTTFVDLQNEVLQFGFNDGPQVNRPRVKNWINEGQFEIARQVEGPEFQTNVSIQLIVGTNVYALPVDFARVQDIIYPQYSTRLNPLDLQAFDMMNPAQITGPPSQYTLDQTNLFLMPTPAAADVLTMRYINIPPVLVNDTDTPQLNINYLHLLVYYAVIKAFEGEDDYEAAQYFQGIYDKRLDSYASDVQWRVVDRPRVIDGTWSYGNVARTF